MSVCMYVYMYVCMYVVYVRTYVCIMHACMFARMCVCTYVCMLCTYVRMDVCTYVCMYVCYVRMYVCDVRTTYARTHVCIHMPIYTYVHYLSKCKINTGSSLYPANVVYHFPALVRRMSNEWGLWIRLMSRQNATIYLRQNNGPIHASRTRHIVLLHSNITRHTTPSQLHNINVHSTKSQRPTIHTTPTSEVRTAATLMLLMSVN
jgi:hypothetical protein